MRRMSMGVPLSSEGTGQPIHFIVRVHHAYMAYQHLLAIWQAADSLGYDGASLYDLLAAPCLECWTTLTMLTMATQPRGHIIQRHHNLSIDRQSHSLWHNGYTKIRGRSMA